MKIRVLSLVSLFVYAFGCGAMVGLSFAAWVAHKSYWTYAVQAILFGSMALGNILVCVYADDAPEPEPQGGEPIVEK